MRRTRDPQERFWEKVNKLAANGCWEWTASVGNHTYGQFRIRTGVEVLAHRQSYEWLRGPIPQGLELDHLCRNRRCVNPDHLEPVTRRVNAQRGETGQHMARRTHCPKGHEYTSDNIYRYPDGRKHCRICRREAVARFYGRRSQQEDCPVLPESAAS